MQQNSRGQPRNSSAGAAVKGEGEEKIALIGEALQALIVGGGNSNVSGPEKLSLGHWRGIGGALEGHWRGIGGALEGACGKGMGSLFYFPRYALRNLSRPGLR